MNSEIEHLKEDSVPPPMPKKDWSKSLFYSHTLRAWKFACPPDQLGLYLFTLTGIGIISKAFWKSWNIKKAAELLAKGVESDMIYFHRHFSGLSTEQLKDAIEVRMIPKILKFKAFALAGMIIGGFTVFVQFKNKNRFDS